jgi:large subunit ribosomal protein L4
MDIKVLNLEGKEGNKSQNLKISNDLMGLKVNNRLLKYVIDWQINHSKKRLAKTKQRNEIVGSTRKIYAQKGTGGARHASRKAPIFIGGGIAHGPKGDNYKIKKINKKIRKIALAQSISKKNINKELYIFEDIKKEIKKTKIFNNFLIKNKLNNVLIVSDKETHKNIFKSVRNIRDVKLIIDEGANIYDFFKFKNILFTETSIKNIQKRLTDEKN